MASFMVALPAVAITPAHAAVTWSGCDTDRFKATAKFEGKVELTIIQRAKGCMEYHTLPDGSTCGVLTSYDASQAVQVTRGRAKQVRKWGLVSDSIPEKIETDCDPAGANTGLFRITEKFTGRYKIDVRGKDPHAVPGLTVNINAANGQVDAETIVKLSKTGSWKFSKRNNKRANKPPTGNDPSRPDPGDIGPPEPSLPAPNAGGG
jgi:hypothetical protein